MAATSRTDVNVKAKAFTYTESKPNLTFSRCRSGMEFHESSKWFDAIKSNKTKHAKGSHSSAKVRSNGNSNHSKHSNSHEMDASAARMLSDPRRKSYSNSEEDSGLHYLTSATNAKEQSNESRSGSGSVNIAENREQESQLRATEQSNVIDANAPSKRAGKRIKKTTSSTEGSKRLKQSASKKNNPWRENSRCRRLVANARERSRIHILSDAFENLRRAVPSYSQDQKLSKLAILKLATYYISALANLAESDTSARSLKQFADCVSHCTQALQTEGRSRRKNF